MVDAALLDDGQSDIFWDGTRTIPSEPMIDVSTVPSFAAAGSGSAPPSSSTTRREYESDHRVANHWISSVRRPPSVWTLHDDLGTLWVGRCVERWRLCAQRGCTLVSRTMAT